MAPTREAAAARHRLNRQPLALYQQTGCTLHANVVNQFDRKGL